jgi:hypothetical protein
MKLTKTEQLLLKRLNETNYGRVGYSGTRQSNAARKLEAKGLVKRHATDGTYFARIWDGSYRRGYHPQGWIELI